MKLITRDTDYAIRALACIARNGNKLISASELVSRLDMPRPFLRKILQRLNKAGVLRSYKGKAGGFSLAIPAAEIKLLDLIDIFQGPVELSECLFKSSLCPNRKKCFLRDKIKGLETRMIAELRPVSIETIIRKSG